MCLCECFPSDHPTVNVEYIPCNNFPASPANLNVIFHVLGSNANIGLPVPIKPPDVLPFALQGDMARRLLLFVFLFSHSIHFSNFSLVPTGKLPGKTFWKASQLLSSSSFKTAQSTLKAEFTSQILYLEMLITEPRLFLLSAGLLQRFFPVQVSQRISWSMTGKELCALVAIPTQKLTQVKLLFKVISRY